MARRSVDRVPSLVPVAGDPALRRVSVPVGVAEGSASNGLVSIEDRSAHAPLGGSESIADPEDVLDLVVVGAGPAGLACSLEAKRHGLSFVTLDQEEQPGGTVAKYPRRKLVVSQPLELPIFGKLPGTSFTKEQLMELWGAHGARGRAPFASRRRLPPVRARRRRSVHGPHRCRRPARAPRVPGPGAPRRAAQASACRARSCPRSPTACWTRARTPGAGSSWVGGGDSAVEAAVGLAEQPGNEVTLSYRKAHFFRIRTRSEERLRAATEAGRLRVIHESEVGSIAPEAVELVVGGPGGERVTLPNDDVFVLAGGVPPVELLEGAGVSFDPALRPTLEAPGERGTGLVRALGIGFGLALATLLWALVHVDYYGLPLEERPAHPKHAFLRPARAAGLWLGIAATGLIVVNLAYLLRRSPRTPLRVGLAAGLDDEPRRDRHPGLPSVRRSTARWHPRNTVGGQAFWALLVLLVTGAIGRYFYAYVPRAANGAASWSSPR